MYVYIYQAALYCEACGLSIRAELTAAGNAPADPDDETSFDSDEFPKGPSEEGESDTPTHCDGCKVFLETTLTSDGQAYVRDIIERDLTGGRIASVAVTVWMPHYDYLDISARAMACHPDWEGGDASE